MNPDATFNGSFLFTGTETGSDFADFLIGVASNFNQADSEAYYGRHKYAAGFAQDSWRATTNVTLNFVAHSPLYARRGPRKPHVDIPRPSPDSFKAGIEKFGSERFPF